METVLEKNNRFPVKYFLIVWAIFFALVLLLSVVVFYLEHSNVLFVLGEFFQGDLVSFLFIGIFSISFHWCISCIFTSKT